ncbi:MAG: HesA/MoeB/ThiF family protein [Flavobacteriaceae bacterium]|nr:HesA/MoeB/ThiF family protein [Flavobacteriaceae bacterium]
MSRYNRHIILSEIGQKGQDKLSKAKVLVIGAGGLGCPVLQYLTAAGIGTIGIVDFDSVSKSNLQRQILYGTSSLGKNKAEAAKARLEDLNNEITIIAYPKKLTHKNAISLFQQYDIIVDGTDNFATRYLVNDASIITKKPLVYAGIYKFEGQISVFNYKDGPSYRCLFPNPPKEGTIPNCSEVGVLGVLPGITGTFQANEVLKIILGIGEVLSGKVLYYNTLTNQTSILKVNRSEAEIQQVKDSEPIFETLISDDNCAILVEEISIKEVLQKKNIQLIDVREKNENPKIENDKVIHIPLSELENRTTELSSEKEIIFFCQAGIKSKRAASIINNSFSLKEGAFEIKEYLNKVK